MNQITKNRRAWVYVIATALTLSILFAVSCATGSPGDGPAPSPVVIEREVVRTVIVEVEKTLVQQAPAPPPVVVERDVVRTVVVEVEKPVVQEVTKVVEVVVTPTPMPPDPTPTPHPDTRVVRDDTGREVEIPYSPERVAVTNSWIVEVLMACDYTPVARPQIPLEFVFPPEAYDILVVAVSHSAGPNIEQLAAVRPDLVLTSPTYGRFAEPIQQALDVPVLIYDVDTVEDVLAKVELLGSMAGCTARAQQAVMDLRSRVEEQQRGLPEPGPSVFGIFGTSESFLGFTSASYLGDMVNLLGGSMITDGDPPYMYRGIPNHAYTPFSLEKVVEQDPEVMLVVRHGSPSETREENFSGLFSNPAWSGLTAAQSGRTHELSEWLYLRYPGPRIVWAMQELRPLLYPDALAESGG
ncbi:MAG: ABC transporter substrate-binding protein [Dehalococcoidia bacterium]|nr:ABC transporter substrate-binding protein [Dehalococcoidia bacterium]